MFNITAPLLTAYNSVAPNWLQISTPDPEQELVKGRKYKVIDPLALSKAAFYDKAKRMIDSYASNKGVYVLCTGEKRGKPLLAMMQGDSPLYKIELSHYEATTFTPAQLGLELMPKSEKIPSYPRSVTEPD